MPIASRHIWSVARAVSQSMRLPFLVLPPLCVLLGAGVAHWHGQPISAVGLLLILFVALAAHSAVNLLNDYHDFRSGLDALTERTPFSGGSGALQARPTAAWAVLAAGWSALALAIGIGLWLVAQVGWPLLCLGVIGALLVVGYTPWANRHPWICWAAPGLAFGPVMVLGSYWVMSAPQGISWSTSLTVFTVSGIPGFLATNLLLLNQLPDIDADRRSGRRHLAIVYGERFALRIYALGAAATTIILWLAVWQTWLPTSALWATFALLPTVLIIYCTPDALGNLAKLTQLLALNVAVTVVTTGLITLALWVD